VFDQAKTSGVASAAAQALSDLSLGAFLSGEVKRRDTRVSKRYVKVALLLSILK
jgi:propanediol dehydratase small subunit